uniref:Uncharacterized protein n=1 Tax=Rhizophora mucronata TaxID=61149 RepID=A0A2P2JHA9_RHIMU
MACAYCGDK